jgi:cytochrome c6
LKKLIKMSLFGIILVGFFLFFSSSNALASAIDSSENSRNLFEFNCAGCHPNGSNIIRRGKNLQLKALKRNKLDSVDAIASFVSQGKNNMPSYKDRLSQQQILEVSHYVLAQAEKGWK